MTRRHNQERLKRDAARYMLVQMVVWGEIGMFQDVGGDPYGLIVCLHRLWTHPDEDMVSCGYWKVKRVDKYKFEIEHAQNKNVLERMVK